MRIFVCPRACLHPYMNMFLLFVTSSSPVNDSFAWRTWNIWSDACLEFVHSISFYCNLFSYTYFSERSMWVHINPYTRICNIHYCKGERVGIFGAYLNKMILAYTHTHTHTIMLTYMYTYICPSMLLSNNSFLVVVVVALLQSQIGWRGE